MLARPLVHHRPLRAWSAISPLALALVMIAPSLYAQPDRRFPVTTVAGGSGAVLAVGLDQQGKLRASVCRGGPCDLGTGDVLDAPRDGDRADLELSLVPIGEGRHVVHVRWPQRSGTWEAVLAAAPGATRPKVLFQGLTGLLSGQPGERSGPMVVISEPEADGTRRVLVGEQREDITLCGRPTVLSPQLVSPADLELHAAKVQRLAPAERARAVRVDAQPRDPAAAGATPGILRGVAASSALGSPAAVTDGNADTFWAENRGGDGRGEFVTLLAPPALPLGGIELVVHPPSGALPQAVAPRELWIATPTELLLATFPVDAWDVPGQAFTIGFPSPVVTDCLALVTETGARSEGNVAVTIAEVTAMPVLGGAAPAQLLERLSQGGAPAEAAAAMLRSLGKEGFGAVARSFPRLDEGARRLALDVMDHAPCEISARVYARALTGPYEAQRVHARARLGRCGDAAAPALLRAFERAKRPEAARLLVEQLSLTAPSRTIEVLVPALDQAGRERREIMRIAIARASASQAATPSVADALANARLGEVASIDLLRALGPRLREHRALALATLARLTAPGASFRSRYLLIEPAAELAEVDATARDLLSKALRADESPWVRTAAAKAVRGPALQDDLLRALQDPEVRVREASAEKLGELRLDPAGAALSRALGTDRWPLVRAAAASAIGVLKPDPTLDADLRRALRDPSAPVRAAVITSLGRRGVGEAALAIRRRLDDSRETLKVRVAAAGALGRLCDQRSADSLTRYARLMTDPFDPSDARQVAPAALAALARLGPPDLERRLAPLLDPRAPRTAQAAAREALTRTPSCRASTPGR